MGIKLNSTLALLGLLLASNAALAEPEVLTSTTVQDPYEMFITMQLECDTAKVVPAIAAGLVMKSITVKEIFYPKEISRSQAQIKKRYVSLTFDYKFEDKSGREALISSGPCPSKL